MTVIVGVEATDNSVVLAADSLASGPEFKQNISGSKIARFQVPIINKASEVVNTCDLLIGIAGSIRYMQVIQYRLELLPQEDDMGDEEYLSTRFISGIMRALRRGKVNTEDYESRAIIGYRGKIYRMQEGFDILRSGNSYSAEGSGLEYATGVLYSLLDNETPSLEIAESVARLAVETACYHHPFCGLPVTVEIAHG
jgi:ATP-dependent protease HslVU (ClpYQ) peptidase subunit